jgi:hypothetical protein
MKVDVGVVSKRGVPDTFKSMVRSAIPVNEFIIDTVTSPLGRARENVIRQIKTEYFVFIDDDVELPAGWFDSVWKHRERLEESGKIGWLESWSIPLRPDWYYKWNRTRTPKLVRLTKQNAANYGNAVVVLTEAVEDWHSPPQLDFGEMLHILCHILDRGYSAWRLPVLSYHNIDYAETSEFWKHTVKGMRSIREARPDLSFLDGLSLCLTTWGSASKAFLKTGDVQIMANGIRWGWNWLRAFT